MVPSLKKEILQKLQKYCAYQDRCHYEVRSKLLSLKVYGADLEDIITDLVEEDFLNEERFARSYARGKFRIKQWGRVRITNELKKRKISEYCIRKAMTEISDEEYDKTALDVFNQMKHGYRKRPYFEARKKITQAMVRRGYEYHVVTELVSTMGANPN